MNIALLYVSVFLSNGITCGGPPVANSSATTPRFNFSVCMTSTEPICGITYAFERIGANGTMRVNSRDQPAGGDVTDPAQVFPFVIPAPGGAITHLDLGGTVDSAPIPGQSNARLATYNVTVLGSKPATSYSFRLSASSMVAIDADGACGNARPSRPIIDRPIAAGFTLKKK